MTVNSGTTFSPTAAAVINAAAPAGTITGSGTIRVSRIAATADYANQYRFTTNTLATMTVDHSGAGAQTVNSTVGTYGNLATSGSGAKTPEGTVTIAGSVTLGSGTSIVANANGMNVGGNWTNNGGTFTAGTGTVTFNGASAQTINGSAVTSFNNLTISNSTVKITANSNLHVSGTMSVNANAVFEPAAAVVVNSAAPAGTVTGSGTLRVTHADADCVRGVVTAGQNPYKVWRFNGYDKPMNPLLEVEGIAERYNAPRQILPPTYWQTGHIDVIRTSTISR